MSMFPDGPGGAPGHPGYHAPPSPQPIPARMGTGGLAGQQFAQNPEAQRALWARQMGLDTGQPLNDFGRFIMSRYQDVVRPWLGAMLLAGNPQSALPELINQFAGVAQGNGLDEFLRGSTGAFLSNPRFQQGLAGKTGREQAGMLRSLVGLGQAPFDPVFGDIAEEQVANAFGQSQLANLERGRGTGEFYNFLASSPQWSWMLR